MRRVPVIAVLPTALPPWPPSWVRRSVWSRSMSGLISGALWVLTYEEEGTRAPR